MMSQTGKSRRRHVLAASLGMSAVALAIAGPVASQESLLPPGFNQAPTPSPVPAPKPTPTPAPPARPPVAPGAPPAGSDLPSPLETDDPETSPVDDVAEPMVRADLPPSSRRGLDRIGVLSSENGGMVVHAFGASGGHYLATLMRETQAPIASRWAAILLRRTLLSQVDTPSTINGADWTAARASLLLRMGEAGGARALVQSVDSDNFTPRLLNVALGAYMANADPGGLCPLVQQGIDRSDDKRWEVARSMCAAMAGEAGIAGSTIDRLRRREGNTIDILLAQRIVGAGAGGRRSVTVQWDDVDRLDGWRLGLATAAGLDIPARLTAPLDARMQAYRTTAAMTPIDARVAAARAAASIGVVSSRAYVDLLGLAMTSQDRGAETLDLAQTLRLAFAATKPADRVAAMQDIWGEDARGNAYGSYVMTARAAAALPVSGDHAAATDALIASMLTGGYDTAAARWARTVDEGSAAWAMIALADPRGGRLSSGDVGGFADDDDSANRLATQFFVAGLGGLNRIDDGNMTSWAEDLGIDLARQTRWTRAIDAAAERGEQASVAVLAGVGMQGRGWDNVSPLHLYHVVRALRRVGLEPEARMIAAEAIART